MRALHAAQLGLLAMVWDVICPSCRIPSIGRRFAAEDRGARRVQGVQHRLRGRFLARDRARVSRVARDSRRRDPHVLHRRPGALPARRGAGPARTGRAVRAAARAAGRATTSLRSPQLPRAHELRVTASGGVRRVDITLGERQDAAGADRGRSAAHDRQRAPREVVVRVERAGDRAFALTAARVMAHAAFRELFPDQALAPGRLMAVTQATLVVAQLDDAQTLFKRARRLQGVPGRGAVLRDRRARSRRSTAARS